MKKIITLRKSLFNEIFLMLLFIVISVPIWQSFDMQIAKSSALEQENYNYIEYEILNDSSFSLTPVSDIYAMQYYETEDIIIYNTSNTKDDYSLILKLDKKIINYVDNLKINVNNEIKYLNEYSSYEKEGILYFVIDSASLVGDCQKYVISMWNTENNLNEQSDLIKYHFLVSKDVYL